MSLEKGFWLMKSDPNDFSIEDMEKAKVEPWTGVRNYQARNFMRDKMRPGDGVLFYHSVTAVPGIYGLAKVCSEAYPDPTQFDKKSKYFDPKSTKDKPRWELVDVEFIRKFESPITLAKIRKNHEKLEGLILIKKGSRLSIMPVSEEHWGILINME